MESDTKEFKKHIIFPLCALSINLELTKLIKYLIDYALVQIAKMELRHLEFIDKHSSMLARKIKHHSTKTFNGDDTLYYPELEEIERQAKTIEKTKLKYYIKRAAKERKINTKKMSFSRIIQNHNVVNQYKEKYEKKSNTDARVLINLYLLYDVRDKNALTEKEFRVLCAIYSCIGQKKHWVITYKMIKYRAMGFKTENSNCEKETLMSNKVLRRIINKLMLRNFFIRHYNGRVFYYSKYLTSEELKNVVENKLKLGLLNRNSFSLQKNNLGKFKKDYLEKLKNLTQGELDEERKKILSNLSKKNKSNNNLN